MREEEGVYTGATSLPPYVRRRRLSLHSRRPPVWLPRCKRAGRHIGAEVPTRLTAAVRSGLVGHRGVKLTGCGGSARDAASVAASATCTALTAVATRVGSRRAAETAAPTSTRGERSAEGAGRSHATTARGCAGGGSATMARGCAGGGSATTGHSGSVQRGTPAEDRCGGERERSCVPVVTNIFCRAH